MSLYSAFAQDKHLEELGTPLVTQGGVLSAATRRATVLTNLGGSAMTAAQFAALAGVTPGTAAASKALVLNSSKELAWAVSDSGTGTVTPINFTLTATGVGADVDGVKFTSVTEAALGNYANAINGKLDFGTAGKVTGLGGVICAELDLGPGTTAGSYAAFEAEINVPAGGKLGTRTSFLSLNVWGADVATFDSTGNLFDLSGVTAGAGKLFVSNAKSGIAMTHTLRVLINGTIYYIALNTSANFGGS